ncbi:olfactory receptor 6N2 [Salmo salar]|uniref:Olfactory receptor n=1 Tax=Salmo salar TaxID=8030 RepID=A0ABM3DKM8_SALSA|nr:olfactory receptor 6N2-like [Salmo salar]
MTNSMANVSQPLEFNVSLFSDFLIHGGELGLKEIYTDLAIFLLVVYIMVVIGNAMIITLVLLDSKLHTPMYIFLCNLSLIDIVITTSVLPKMISVCLWNDVSISFAGCFLQMYTYLTFQTAEGFLLCAMAYDRYVAICNPLRYNSIMTFKVCVILASTAWALGIILPALNVILASQLPFCSNQIMYWFCDYPPIVTLSCLDTTLLIDLALACALFVMYVPFTVIIWSYCKIIKSVCKIATSEGRKKAFSTCSSHLIVVLTFYTAHSCVYISAKSYHIHPNVLILISIVNCILTPLVNPLVYSFRNKQIKDSVLKLLFSNKVIP